MMESLSLELAVVRNELKEERRERDLDKERRRMVEGEIEVTKSGMKLKEYETHWDHILDDCLSLYNSVRKSISLLEESQLILRREDNDNVEDMVGSIEERQSTKESCEKEAEVVDWDDYLDEVD
ncbi:hypothetical protein PRIPAC_70954 [Pristionchus pacificus]|nr:hypothetical protein PRIPAC_70954 [Pristionchus pacificus]